MITKYIKGNILDTELNVIAHGVNTQNVMGSGIAKVLSNRYGEIKTEYHRYCGLMSELGFSKKELLGNVEVVFPDINEDLQVYNCFTQEFYGKDKKRYVNYRAIVDCFKQLRYFAETDQLKGPLAIPKIGCGLAGGDWNIVEQLINDTVEDKLEIWVYEL